MPPFLCADYSDSENYMLAGHVIECLFSRQVAFAALVLVAEFSVFMSVLCRFDTMAETKSATIQYTSKSVAEALAKHADDLKTGGIFSDKFASEMDR